MDQSLLNTRCILLTTSALPSVRKVSSHRLEHGILDSQYRHMLGQVVEILKIASENSAPRSNELRCFGHAHIREPSARPVHHERQSLNRPLRGMNGLKECK